MHKNEWIYTKPQPDIKMSRRGIQQLDHGITTIRGCSKSRLSRTKQIRKRVRHRILNSAGPSVAHVPAMHAPLLSP